MPSISESCQKKLEAFFLRRAKEWANSLNVKHRGMDVWELHGSFEEKGYKLDWSQIGSELVFCVVDLKSGKNVRDGRVFLSPDSHSDAVIFEEL
ncbi:hypothetical protein [Paenibacillus elgii]|uniref:hypothetical protein n=1 Tax=Paenibacillus elgii TaxID=189691 RepID=UPI0013D71F78|nr:hypothetical protein [Paenibacillus elgii]